MPLQLEEETVSAEPHLNADEEKRLSSLFNRLDVNHDGRIDVHDLSKALQKLRIPHVPGQAQVKRFYRIPNYMFVHVISVNGTRSIVLFCV